MNVIAGAPHWQSDAVHWPADKAAPCHPRSAALRVVEVLVVGGETGQRERRDIEPGDPRVGLVFFECSQGRLSNLSSNGSAIRYQHRAPSNIHPPSSKPRQSADDSTRCVDRRASIRDTDREARYFVAETGGERLPPPRLAAA